MFNRKSYLSDEKSIRNLHVDQSDIKQIETDAQNFDGHSLERGTLLIVYVTKIKFPSTKVTFHD